jgi:hypothetical protein
MSAARKIHPDQLKMFMTPKEIHQHYQLWEGDREDAPRAGELTHSTRTTGGRPTKAMGTQTRENWQVSTGTRMRAYNEESDEQFWLRKTMDSQMDPEEYFEHRHGTRAPDPYLHAVQHGLLARSTAPQSPGTDRTTRWESYDERARSYMERKHEEQFGGQSLWGSVRQEGVKSPVHLGTQFGERGKPQIVGGHHRIAAAMDTRPNQLIPVLHHEGGVSEAQEEGKRKGGFKYS